MESARVGNMVDFKVVFVVVLWVCTVVSDETDEFLKHSQGVSPEKFPCSEPQPRVFYLRDLMEEKKYYKEYKDIIRDIRPYGTILHTCKNSGCCSRYNERCDAMDEDEIDLTFMAIRGSSVKYFRVPAKNHTLCGCQKISENLIK